MSIKTTAKDKEKGADYPKLRRYTGSGKGPFICFFLSPSQGFVVFSDNPERRVGFYAADFNEAWFEDYEGTITLENK